LFTAGAFKKVPCNENHDSSKVPLKKKSSVFEGVRNILEASKAPGAANNSIKEEKKVVEPPKQAP
jgi:hypothetical protein